MNRVVKLLQVLTSHEQMGTDGPRDVRVFSGDTFLFASYDHGRERLIDVRAHSRDSLRRYFYEWQRQRNPHGSTAHRIPESPSRQKDNRPQLPSLLSALRKVTGRR